MSKELHNETPREQDGRDSFERYRAQVRSASIAALTILEGSEVDRIYCDLHDDFVKRRSNGGGYDFYQVKTKSKQNHNWSLNEVFGIKSRGNTQSLEDIENSFASKLLLHTIVFDDNCNSVIFQTNINNHDHIESVIKDISSGEFTNKHTKVLIDNFNECISKGKSYSEDEIKKRLTKLKFETDVQYLKSKNNNFDAIVRDKIYRYSEVDLDYFDTQEIIMKLLELVSRKSSGKIDEYTLENIENQAGIAIDDLLSILSISKEAYESLKNGGDPKAIKNVSIIQRSLQAVGVENETIKYCSKCKLDWDEWYRNNRHTLFGLDLITITDKIKYILQENLKLNGGYVNLRGLSKPIKDVLKDLEDEDILFGLNGDLILGAIFSEIVRMKS
ncbi:TPA: DUF4297 domain-containing protein [Vibrio parahaemolyticus]|nr:DUF4297 domain-containing protein [Vibrio parahaemolyticus]